MTKKKGKRYSKIDGETPTQSLKRLEKRANKQIKKMATDDTTSITDFVKTTNKLTAAFALAKLTVEIGEEMERVLKK